MCIRDRFFALFALFFVQSVYRVLAAWRQGPDRAHLLLYVLLAAAFAWFSVSSFARAYRKSRRLSLIHISMKRRKAVQSRRRPTRRSA